MLGGHNLKGPCACSSAVKNFRGLTDTAQLDLRTAKSLEHRQMSDSRQAPGDLTNGYCVFSCAADGS